MTILKSAAILAMAGLLVSTSFATAGISNPLSGPTRIDRPPVEHDLGHGHGRGGGDGSGPRSDQPVFSTDVPKVSPFALSCRFSDGWFWFKNVGTETILAGTVITIHWADGTISTVTAGSDIKPGGGFDISKQPGIDYSKGMHCSASV